MAYSLARSDAAGPRAVVPGGAAEMAILAFLIVVTLYFGQAVLVPLALAVILSFVLAPARAPAPPSRAAQHAGRARGRGRRLRDHLRHRRAHHPAGWQPHRGDAALSAHAHRQGQDAQGRRGWERWRHRARQRNAQGHPEGARQARQQGRAAGADHRTPLGDGILGRSDAAPLPVEVRTPQSTALDKLQSIIGIVLAPLATTGLVILFVMFLLMRREDVRDRAIRLLGSNDLEKSTAAMDDAGDRLVELLPGADRDQRRLRLRHRHRALVHRRAEPHPVGRARHADAVRAVHRLRSSPPSARCCWPPPSIPAGPCSCRRSRCSSSASRSWAT